MSRDESAPLPPARWPAEHPRSPTEYLWRVPPGGYDRRPLAGFRAKRQRGARWRHACEGGLSGHPEQRRAKHRGQVCGSRHGTRTHSLWPKCRLEALLAAFTVRLFPAKSPSASAIDRRVGQWRPGGKGVPQGDRYERARGTGPGGRVRSGPGPRRAGHPLRRARVRQPDRSGCPERVVPHAWGPADTPIPGGTARRRGRSI